MRQLHQQRHDRVVHGAFGPVEQNALELCREALKSLGIVGEDLAHTVESAREMTLTETLHQLVACLPVHDAARSVTAASTSLRFGKSAPRRPQVMEDAVTA